jgi:hypothetical protein
MADKNNGLSKLHSELGYKRLNRTWAKIEILVGLGTAAGGLFLGVFQLSRTMAEVQWGLVAAGLVLMVLGSYLAMAGNRSHLYQSNNELTAHLIEEIRRIKDKG